MDCNSALETADPWPPLSVLPVSVWQMVVRKAGGVAKALSALLASSAEPLTLELEKHSVSWMDVSVPFDKCALRVRLFQSEDRRHDNVAGQVTRTPFLAPLCLLVPFFLSPLFVESQ